MTRHVPGRTPHHDGDGCNGQPRPIDATGTDAIRYRAKRLILRATQSDWDETVIHGDWVAVHYGPDGEYLLSTLLAGHIHHGRRAHPFPQLAHTVPPSDPEAAALFERLISHRKLTSTPTEQDAALEAARPLLQTFVLDLYAGDPEAARNHWLSVYNRGAEQPLIPLALAALLITWAARAMFDSEPARRTGAPLERGTTSS